jgi:hypothetical protein
MVYGSLTMLVLKDNPFETCCEIWIRLILNLYLPKALQKAVEDQEIQDALDALLKEGRFPTIYR